MAKASKETKKTSSAKKLKTIVKVTAKVGAKNVKTLKNMVGGKKGLKVVQTKKVSTEKVVNGVSQKKLVNGISHAKTSPKGREKSHGKGSHEKQHVDKLTSSTTKLSPKAETSKVTPKKEITTPKKGITTPKKGITTPKKGITTPKKTVAVPSKAVTRRDSRENETTEVPKPTSSKAIPSKVTPSESDGKKNKKETGSNSPEEEQPRDTEQVKPRDTEQAKAVKRVTFNVQVKSPKKVPMSKVEPKKKSIVIDRRRVASLNATCKVKMMYEEKEDGKKELKNKELKKSSKKDGGKEIKTEAKEVKRGEKVVKRKKKVPLKRGKKRKNQDDVDTSLILDCRSSKRVASLNASAILACTLLPDPPLPKYIPKPREKPAVIKVVETVDEKSEKRALEIDVDCQPEKKRQDQKNAEQKKIQKKSATPKTITPKTISPKTISPKKTVTLKSSQGSSSKRSASSQLESVVALVEGINPSVPSLKSSNSHRSSSPKVTGMTTTKLEVTKVQINSSASSRKEKTDHQVNTILGRKDFVSKYQIETNSSQSYCVRVHNSSVETHHQPLIDPSTLGSVSSLGSSSSLGSTILNVPPAHMDSTIMTTQSLASSFPPFSSHIQGQGQTRPHMMHIGSVQGLPSFTPLPILNIPHFTLPSVPGSSHGSHHLRSTPFGSSHGSHHLRSTPFGIIPSPLDLSHGNYHHHPSTVTAASGFTLLGHSPMYQPAGPMIQSSSDSSCLVHKPIPFHPPPTQLPSHLTPSLHPPTQLPSHLTPSLHPHASSSASSALPFQRLQHQPTQLTQSLSSVSGHLFQPNPPPGLFHHHQQRLQQSHLQPSQHSIPSIFVSNVHQPTNLGVAFNHSLPLSTQPSLPTIIQGSNDGGFAPRNVPPWFPDGSSPRTASVPSYPPSKGSSSTTKSTATYHQHFPSRSPHVATVRPQVSKKQKESNVRNKKNATTKELVHRQPAPIPQPVSQPGAQRRELAPPKPVPQPVLTSPKAPKRRFPHGWSWFGKRFTKRVFVHGEGIRVKDKPCFAAIKHVEGEIIRVGDSVLLRSGPKKTDLPFVARITALWESSDGEMMMSLLWYYRPEHTEMGRTPRQMTEELFASKHRDVNSVACVDDKCYVLTLNEFNRFKRFQHMIRFCVSKSLSDGIVPRRPDQVMRKSRIPPLRTSSDMVFCCRKVYEFRLKRTLKNPA